MSQMLPSVRRIVRNGQWRTWISVWAMGCMLVSLVLDLERVWSHSDWLFFFSLRAILLCVFLLEEVDGRVWEGMDERDQRKENVSVQCLRSLKSFSPFHLSEFW